MSNEGFVRLSDGRKLTYRDYGPKSGQPVFLFHGTPGSRLEHGALSVLAQTNTRLIVADRPGFGLSDFQKGRKLLDWPDDVSQLADTLELDNFAVMGFSGGGPYAAACAHNIPDRLSKVCLISSTAPFDLSELRDYLPPNYPLYELAARDYRQAEQQIGQMLDSDEALFNFMEASVSSVDRKVFADDEFRNMYAADMKEACRQGYAGLACDMAIMAQPWGFHVSQLTIPVHLWHGAEDSNVAIAMGHYLANSIPQCQAKYIEGAGHCLMFDRWQKILQELAG